MSGPCLSLPHAPSLPVLRFTTHNSPSPQRHQVSELFALARSLVDDGLCPWACFSCWGHADSPIAWAGHEHSIHPQGHSSESQYTVLVLPAGAYCSFVALGSNELTLAAGGKPSATPQ